jgi:hypothetical protein
MTPNRSRAERVGELSVVGPAAICQAEAGGSSDLP